MNCCSAHNIYYCSIYTHTPLYTPMYMYTGKAADALNLTHLRRLIASGDVLLGTVACVSLTKLVLQVCNMYI